jgi:hypothetical protein
MVAIIIITTTIIIIMDTPLHHHPPLRRHSLGQEHPLYLFSCERSRKTEQDLTSTSPDLRQPTVGSWSAILDCLKAF